MSRPFVAYYRVSTARQGASGLGLDAQRAAVAVHLGGVEPIAEFQEVESGKRNDRPQLAAALAFCKKRKAVLVIAKLDRLARNVHFISGLMESGVDFVACDNPQATRLVLHMLAAVAENEAQAISERTKAALRAAKARGVKLGGTRGNSLEKARAVRQGDTAAFRGRVLPIIREIQMWSPKMTLTEMAAALNSRGVKTRQGGEWHAKQVSRILEGAV